MNSDIRTILDFVLAARLRDICERRGVSPLGSREEQRERVVKSLSGDVAMLLPLLVRAELVEFLATRGYAFVSGAGRWDLERLLKMACAGDPAATVEQPLGAGSPIRYERKLARPRPVSPPAPPPPPGPRPPVGAPVSEKVFRSRVKRQPGLIYYVKDGDVWAAPSRRGGSRRAPQRVHEAGVATDHVTYLYYVDGDGDIARKRRDRAPLGVSTGGDPVDGPVRVFVVYARTDRLFLADLVKMLAPLESLEEITVFFDERTDPGTVWEPALLAKVREAEVAILLLSADFFVSRYCNETEWPVVEGRHRRGECELAPVLVRPCLFEATPIGAHQLIRPNNKAVAQHPNADDAWLEVAVRLRKVFENAQAKRR